MWTEILPFQQFERTRYEKTIEGGDQLRVETDDRRNLGIMGILYLDGRQVEYQLRSRDGKGFVLPRWGGPKEFPWETRFGEHFRELGTQVPSLRSSLELYLRTIAPTEPASPTSDRRGKQK